MIIGKRAFARIAFPLHVALVLLGYRLCPVLCRPCVPGTSGFRSSFRLFRWTRCAGFRPTITTGEFVEKVAKLHFPALGGHSGTTVRQFQPSCDVTTYTVDPSAVASRCIDSRASGGKLKLRMRSQTRVTKPKAWTLRVSLKSSLDRVPQKRKKRFGVFCWGPVVAVVVSLVLVLSSLWSGFPCSGWVSFWLPPFVSKERAATQEPTNFSSRIQLIGTVQRTGTLSGIPNGCGEPPRQSAH